MAIASFAASYFFQERGASLMRFFADRDDKENLTKLQKEKMRQAFMCGYNSAVDAAETLSKEHVRIYTRYWE